MWSRHLCESKRYANPTETRELSLEGGARARAVLHLSPQPEAIAPLIYCAGFGTFGSEHSALIDTFNAEGRHVLTVDHLRETRQVAWHPERLKAEAYRKAMEWVYETHEEYGPFDMVCHSEGGINGPMAALRAERDGVHLVGNAVLVAPAGLIREENIVRLALCTPKVGLQAIKFARHHLGEAIPIGLSMAEYIARNPGRAALEALAISRSYNLPYLQELHGHGVSLALLSYHADGYFPSDSIQYDEVIQTFDRIGELFERHADHSALVFDKKTTIACSQFLEQLKRERQYALAA